MAKIDSKLKIIRVFRLLNRKCLEIEFRLKKEILVLNRNLLARLKKEDPFLSDYCLSITCALRLAESAPSYQDLSDNIISQFTFFANLAPPYHEHDADWQRLGDGKDYNPNKYSSGYIFKNEPHCFLMRKFIDALDEKDYTQLIHIGDILIDIKPEQEIVIKLRGKKTYKSERMKYPPIVVADLL